MASEGQKAENINQANGEAQAIILRAEASAKGLETIAKAIGKDKGSDAVSMSIAEKYVNAFGQMAKESTTLIVPATANDAASLVTQVRGLRRKRRGILLIKFFRHYQFTSPLMALKHRFQEWMNSIGLLRVCT